MLTNFENSHDHSKKLVNFPFIKQAINGDYDFKSSGRNHDYVKNLATQIEHFIQAQKITKPLIQRRNGIIKHLTKILTNKFLNAKLTSFGSFESGLSLANGDIDLCLEFDGEPPKKVLKKIARMLNEDGMKDGEGEIVVKGPNIMMGYFNKADETKKVLTNDGWFHTGDIGRLVDDKYLKITDRKKEIFKTSGGKYIAPQVMENKFKESRLIEQIIVIGEGEKHAAALIVPSTEGLNFWCNKHKVNIKEITEIIKNDKVLKKFDNEVEQFNSFFNPYERIKVFRLLSSPWSVDGGELTATMKLRRKNIIKKYSKQYNEIYR